MDISRFVCPPGWEWVGDWAPAVDSHTDAEGWTYNKSFTFGNSGFHPGEEAMDWVRTRKLIRKRKYLGFANVQHSPAHHAPRLAGGFGGHRGSGGDAPASPHPEYHSGDLQRHLSGLSLGGSAGTDGHHLIFVDVISGRKIPKMDLVGLSDPFCILRLVGNDGQNQHTNTIQNTTEPVWKETHWFNVTKDDKLIVDCYDEDPVGKDFIGSFTIPLEDVLSGKIKHKDAQWYQLKNKGKDAGEIQLSFS